MSQTLTPRHNLVRRLKRQLVISRLIAVVGPTPTWHDLLSCILLFLDWWKKSIGPSKKEQIILLKCSSAFTQVLKLFVFCLGIEAVKPTITSSHVLLYKNKKITSPWRDAKIRIDWLNLSWFDRNMHLVLMGATCSNHSVPRGWK